MFGEGVRIKNITLEITDEPVTWGVVQKHLGKRKSIGPYMFAIGEKR